MATICHHTMSLDGFITGPDDAMDWLADQGSATALADETMARIGAILGGRREGLLDELVIHLAPVLLGDGVRLYGGEGDPPVTLRRVSLGEADRLTDLQLKIVR